MGQIAKIDATLLDKFGVRVRVLHKAEMPIKVSKQSVTIGIPILGSVMIYYMPGGVTA